ncbi:MAG TPA: serine hydrolase [Phycisphaerales bacterium]|nr:serine hydrolase [Phycisphaerales bacterium]
MFHVGFTVALLTITSGAALAQKASSTPKPLVTDANQAVPAGFTTAADYSANLSGRAVLIMHKGSVLFERYDHDWSATRPHMLASGTKSFTGVVAMFAVQDGLFTLDEKVADTITQWHSDERKRDITVRHLLTLSSGLDPADAAFPTRAERAGFRGQRNEITDARSKRIEREDGRTGVSKLATGNWFKDAVNVPMKHNAGEQFEYGPSHFYVFGEFMNRKLAAQSKINAKTFEEYAKLRIFEPLGISIGRWGKDEAGNVNMPGGMMLTAREWAKFGQFVLQRGAWKQPDGSMKQLIRPDLLAQCFEPSATNSAYGFTWWLGGTAREADTGGAETQRDNADAKKPAAVRLRDRVIDEASDTRITINGKDTPVYMAAGLGKQRLFVLPELDLVVVRFAEPSREGRAFSNEEFLKPIVEAVSK